MTHFSHVISSDSTDGSLVLRVGPSRAGARFTADIRGANAQGMPPLAAAVLTYLWWPQREHEHERQRHRLALMEDFLLLQPLLFLYHTDRREYVAQVRTPSLEAMAAYQGAYGANAIGVLTREPRYLPGFMIGHARLACEAMLLQPSEKLPESLTRWRRQIKLFAEMLEQYAATAAVVDEAEGDSHALYHFKDPALPLVKQEYRIFFDHTPGALYAMLAQGLAQGMEAVNEALQENSDASVARDIAMLSGMLGKVRQQVETIQRQFHTWERQEFIAMPALRTPASSFESFREMAQRVVFLEAGANPGSKRHNRPVNAERSVRTDWASDTVYAYAVINRSADMPDTAMIRDQSRKEGGTPVTFRPRPWQPESKPWQILPGDLSRFIVRMQAYRYHHERLEPEMRELIETLQNVIFLVPENSIGQYDALGEKDRGGRFIQADKPWKTHTVEMGSDGYPTFRHELWHYLDALLGVHERSFFQKLIGYLPPEGGKPVGDGPVAAHILSYRRESNGQPLYQLSQVPMEAGARGYEFWLRKANGELDLNHDAISKEDTLEAMLHFKATAMYVQEVALPVARILTAEARRYLDAGWELSAFMEDRLAEIREEELSRLERKFVERHPVLPDGRESAELLSMAERLQPGQKADIAAHF